MGDDPVHLTSTLYNDYQHPHSLLQSPHDLMAHLDRLKFFLATAPSRWSAPDAAPNAHQHPALNRFLLPSGEYVTCVLWSGLYHITGTDIVRALVFRFEAFGRPVRNMKKFEEGVFSDLRNLKPGHDACLEEPKSPFLDLLFKYQCIRTQKKQKVFYWFSVPHDRLFLDALERDLKREKMGLESTTSVVAEPAASFSYDPKRSLYEQFAAATKPSPADPEGSLTRVVRQVHAESTPSANDSEVSLPELDYPSTSSSMESTITPCEPPTPPAPAAAPPPPHNARTPFFHMLSLFEGSPTYKQRRKKVSKSRKGAVADESDRDRPRVRTQFAHSFLAGPGQFGGASTGFPPSAHVSRLAQQMRAQHHVSEHTCPLLTCRMVCSTAELLHEHMRTHEGEQERRMDVDGNSPHVAESPEMPQFAHMLTSPSGSPEYEDQQQQQPTAYNPPAQWAYSAAVPAPPPEYVQNYNTYDSSTTSGSPSDAPPAPSSQLQQQHTFYQPLHPYPVSAPAHRLTFDLSSAPASSSTSNPAYMGRRPRSVTPTHPDRVTHARRPSTANEVPTAFGSSSGGVAGAWRHHHAGLPHPRGYHPYAAPVSVPVSVERAYRTSTDSARSYADESYADSSARSFTDSSARSYTDESAHSSPGTSPFAVTVAAATAPVGEYAAPEYAHPFAHMVESGPVEGLQLSYAQEQQQQHSPPDAYEEVYGGSPASSVSQQPSDYEYEYAQRGSGEYVSEPPSPPRADADIYQHMVQGHGSQLYYEQQVA